MLFHLHVTSFTAKEVPPKADEVSPTPVATPQRKRMSPDGSEPPQSSVASSASGAGVKKVKPTPGPLAAIPTSMPGTPEMFAGDGDGKVDGEPDVPKPKFLPGGLTHRQAWGLSPYIVSPRKFEFFEGWMCFVFLDSLHSNHITIMFCGVKCIYFSIL